MIPEIYKSYFVPNTHCLSF